MCELFLFLYLYKIIYLKIIFNHYTTWSLRVNDEEIGMHCYIYNMNMPPTEKCQKSEVQIT